MNPKIPFDSTQGMLHSTAFRPSAPPFDSANAPLRTLLRTGFRMTIGKLLIFIRCGGRRRMMTTYENPYDETKTLKQAVWLHGLLRK